MLITCRPDKHQPGEIVATVVQARRRTDWLAHDWRRQSLVRWPSDHCNDLGRIRCLETRRHALIGVMRTTDQRNGPHRISTGDGTPSSRDEETRKSLCNKQEPICRMVRQQRANC